MSRHLQRFVFWLLIAGYVAGSAWWIWNVPYAPEKLLRAIPGHAVSVSMHDNLAGRWNEIAEHPITLSLVGVFGGDAEEWKELRDDPGFQYLLNLLGRKELSVAYVPYPGYQAEPMFVFASWIGGKSHRLRWTLPFFDLPGLSYVGEIGGWPVWVYRWSDQGSVRQISMALVEGMVIGCNSVNLAAIDNIIASYNGEYPSIASRKDLDHWNQSLLNSSRHDRFWYKEPTSRKNKELNGPWLVEFDLANPARVKGSARMPAPDGFGEESEPFAVQDLARLWQSHPIAACALSAEGIRESGFSTNRVPMSLALDLVNNGNGKALALGLFGGDFSGRYKGIKIPTLMAAVQLPEQTDTVAFIQQTVDRWNARYRWGLVAVAQGTGSSTVYRLEGTTDSVYSGFIPQEQVAMTQAGQWLVISSNLKGLEALVAHMEQSGSDSVPWAEQIDQAVAGGAMGYLGMDLARGAETFRLAISAYSLKLLFEDATGSTRTRQTLNEAKAWLDLLAQMDHLHVYGTKEGPYLTIDFDAGP